MIRRQSCETYNEISTEVRELAGIEDEHALYNVVQVLTMRRGNYWFHERNVVALEAYNTREGFLAFRVDLIHDKPKEQ